MKSLTQFVRWVAAVAVASALLLAVPVVLVTAPSPLDRERGVRSLIKALVEDTQVFDESVVSLLVALGWILWTYMAAVFVLELTTAVAGAASRNIRGLSFGQSLARPLVGALMWSSTASAVAMSVIGAGGVVAATSQVAYAQEAPESARHWAEASAQNGHVYVMKGEGDDEATPSEPIVISDGNGTLLVDGQLVRPHLVVIKDDTMWDLAEKHLSDPFRWVEIAELNLGRPQQHSPVVTDPDLIWPGTVLYMPGDAIGLNVPPAPVVQEPTAAEPASEEEVERAPEPEPEITVWTPEPDRLDSIGDDDATVALPEVDESESTGRDDFGANADIPWWLVAAGAAAAGVFSAGMLRRIARRRDRDQALGATVEDDSDLEALLEELEEPEPDLRTHLLSAAASLRAELVGVDAPMLQVDADQTTAVFTEVVRPREDSAWSYSGDDGERSVWALLHSDEPSYTPGAGFALYGVGDNVFLNLEAIGWLGLEGVEDLVAGHLRHLVHDLVGNFGQEHELVLRVGRPGMIDGAEVYGTSTIANVDDMRSELAAYMGQVDSAHAEMETALASELRESEDAWPTLVLIVDLAECDALEETRLPLHRFPGRYPVAIVSVGVSSGAPWVARIESPNEMAIESTYLNKAPRVRPQIMTTATAEALAAELTSKLSKKRWESNPDAIDDAEPASPEDLAEDGWIERAVDSHFDTAAATKNGHTDIADEATADLVYLSQSDVGHAQTQDLGAPWPTSSDLPVDHSEFLERPSRADPVLVGDENHAVTDASNARFSPRKVAQVGDFLYSDGSKRDGSEIEAQATAAAEDDTRPQIRLLGRPTVTGIDVELSDRELAAATLLALTPEGLDRAEILHHIWGGRDVDPRQVRKVLTALQVALGELLERDGSIVQLPIDTDIAEVERNMGRSADMPWSNASALIRHSLELIQGEPFHAISGKYWDWVDNEGAQPRRRLVERVETALVAVADRAELEGDSHVLADLGAAGLRINPLSQRMATYAATGSAGSGDAAAALDVVARWEAAFEDMFDEDPPSDLRATVKAITHDKVG